MKLIKTRLGWRRWMLANVAGIYGGDLSGHPEPKAYPCYAYAVVQSFGYEEERPEYLYPTDLAKMTRLLEQAGATP